MIVDVYDIGTLDAGAVPAASTIIHHLGGAFQCSRGILVYS